MYIDLEIGLELLLEIELGIRLIMNLEIGLGLLEEINLEVLLLVLPPQNNIFYEYIFIETKLLPHKPPTPNQFQYPRQDQMTLNILLLIINY